MVTELLSVPGITCIFIQSHPASLRQEVLGGTLCYTRVVALLISSMKGEKDKGTQGGYYNNCPQSLGWIKRGKCIKLMNESKKIVKSIDWRTK